MKAIKETPEDYYDRPKGCEHKAATIIIIGMTLSLAVIGAIVSVGCERTQAGGWEECCWICKTRVIDYKPQPGVETFTMIIKYADSTFCDCTDEYIKGWEIANSDTLYIDGMRREQVSQCYK